MIPPFFEVENLTKHFGGLTAVNGVSFQIGRDEIVGLIGPNGSGKTTLLRLITGILKPDSGKVRFKTWRQLRHSPQASIIRPVLSVSGCSQLTSAVRAIAVDHLPRPSLP